MLFTTPGLEQYISGVILFDETLRQCADDGRQFVEVLAASGIVSGIKVDRGAIPLASASGEQITEGLDGLRERLDEYRTFGARFAKWRAVIKIGDGRPSDYCLDTNAHALDRVFTALRDQRVVLEHILLKPNMVVPGTDTSLQVSVREVAVATVSCLRRTVPAAVSGIVFPLWRSEGGGRNRPPERHECNAEPASLAAQLLIRPSFAGAGIGRVGRRAAPRRRWSTSPPASRPV